MTHLKKLAMCFIVCIFLISGCANSEEKEIYQSENLIKIGLVDEEGHEYLNEEVGGSSCGTIEGIPAGTYQFIVRSCQENSVSLSESKLVLGAAAFLYEEEGFD